MANLIQPDQLFLALLILAVLGFVFLMIFFYRWKEHDDKVKGRISYLERKERNQRRLIYGEKYKCGYCSLFGKFTDCPREETAFDSEPCEVFELARTDI